MYPAFTNFLVFTLQIIEPLSISKLACKCSRILGLLSHMNLILVFKPSFCHLVRAHP